MIRRGFWMAVGAALGVSGYRRASRLARTVFPAGAGTALAARSGGRARPPAITGRSLLAAAASAGRGTAQGVAFARDVREGMAEYFDRQGTRQAVPSVVSETGSGPARTRSARSRPGRCTGASAPASRPDDSH
jgi:hypothetical protein